MKLLKFKIDQGQEIIEVLTKKFKSKNIHHGSIVSIIGATESCCISNMPNNDPKKDILTEYNIPFELSGTGEIRDGKPHIHCTLSGENNNAIHGHLHWAKVQAWFINIYVIIE
ncbi:MAG: PPC domain-containing DNA-binding protein [Candidatus Gracilibacteria bacterium]|jgi:predicted DNA-binding protein with PD1-like motif